MRHQLPGHGIPFVLTLAAIVAGTPPASGDRIAAPELCVPGARDPLGVVVAASGDLWAEADECGRLERRPLACGESIRAGDRIVTGPDAVIALEVGDVYAQLAPGSELRVERAGDGALDLALVRGRARVIGGPAGSVYRLGTPTLASVGGADTEALVSADGTRLCEWAGGLTVRAPGQADGRALGPGECVGLATEASVGVSLADARLCELALGDGLEPFDVAGGPDGPGFPPIDPYPPPPPSCLGGACGDGGPTGIPVVETPPVFELPPD